jgi:GxxExxY protein
MELIYREEVYVIVGAAMEVHKELGCGFLEAVYQEALELEFQLREIPHQREAKLDIYYKDLLLKKHYVADFICFDKIVVELKALSTITSEHESQLLNYLKATDMELGILINFGTTSLQTKRMIR